MEHQFSESTPRQSAPRSSSSQPAARPATSQPSSSSRRSTSSHARSSSSSTAKPKSSTPTGAELATAFDGKLEPSRKSPLFALATFFVFIAMVLLPLVYLAMIAAAAAGVVWYATHAAGMFQHVRGRAVILAGIIYVAPLIAGFFLVLFMTLPLFWRRQKRQRPMWVDRREQPLLFAYIDKLCETMHAPKPIRIDIAADANASAHIDNGLFGIIAPKLVLTIGLPLVDAMPLREFTGVIAHELGHFSQGISMRLSYACHRINGWFLRLAYEPNGLDDFVDGMLGDEPHWSIALIGLMCKLVLGIARLLLKLMAFISHALSMQLSRQAEFDADYAAGRIVGSEAMGRALEVVPYVGAASQIAIESAQQGWARRALPDDLVMITAGFMQSMPKQIKDKITANILSAESHWLDTHPPLFKRIATLKKAKLNGVLKLDAASAVLFRDYAELRKMATISLYQAVLGDNLKAEYLVEVKPHEPTQNPEVTRASRP